jgi:hypothetical protein
MQTAEMYLDAIVDCMIAEFGGGIEVDTPAALALIEADRAAVAQAERERLTESYAPNCRRCQARTEPPRWCYAIPVCFACLPPPPPIERLELMAKP